MLKSATAVMAAAFLAAVITVLSVPTAKVDARPSLKPATAAPACSERAWPYNNCVGTSFGPAHIRLVTTDRLDQ